MSSRQHCGSSSTTFWVLHRKCPWCHPRHHRCCDCQASNSVRLGPSQPRETGLSKTPGPQSCSVTLSKKPGCLGRTSSANRAKRGIPHQAVPVCLTKKPSTFGAGQARRLRRRRHRLHANGNDNEGDFFLPPMTSALRRPTDRHAARMDW